MKDPTEVSLADVSRETSDRLQIHADLLTKWNSAINLVARSTISDIWNRHILDSMQLFRHGAAGRTWVDVGSGAGFPGMIIAILARESAPGLSVTLIEPDQRKVAFLNEVARLTGTEVCIIGERIETIAPLQTDILSARGLAPLDRLLCYTSRHIVPDGVAIFPKGARFQEEIAVARKSWDFDCEVYQSLTNARAVVLKIQGVVRV